MKSLNSEDCYPCLSEAEKRFLEDYMRQIDEWVYDPTSKERKGFTVESNILRKALSFQVKRLYGNTGITQD